MDKRQIQGLLGLGACAGAQLLGAALAGPAAVPVTTVALTAFGNLLGGVASNFAYDEGRGALAALKARLEGLGRRELPINHDLARALRLSQIDAVDHVAAAYSARSGASPSFARHVATWSKAARLQARDDRFFTNGDDERTVEALFERVVQQDADQVQQGRLAAEGMREELRHRFERLGRTIPDEFLTCFDGGAPPSSGWLAAAEAFFAFRLKQQDAVALRAALNLAQGQAAQGAMRAIQAKLDDIISRSGALGEGLSAIGPMLEARNVRALAPRIGRPEVAAALYEATVNSTPLAEAIEQLRRGLPTGTGWDQTAAQVARRMEGLASTPLFGRERELEFLDDFIRERPSGLLVLTGAARSGKSMLLAHWARAQADACATHLIDAAFERTVTRAECLGHLCAQVDALAGRPYQTYLEGPGLQHELFRLLCEWDGTKRLIVVVDGLDHSLEPIQPFVEAPLPPGVFVIVSCTAGEQGAPACESWLGRIRLDSDGTQLHLSDIPRSGLMEWALTAVPGLTLEDADGIAQALEQRAASPDLSSSVLAGAAGLRGAALQAELDRQRFWTGFVDAQAAALARDRAAHGLMAVAMRGVIAQNESISIFGQRAFGGHVHLKLDHIYTALRGDVLAGEERGAAHRRHENLQGGAAFTAPHVPTERDRRIRLEMAATKSVIASIGPAAAYQGDVRFQQGVRQTLASAIGANPTLVILGEPASGKSTLLKWLALRFAQAWFRHDGRWGALVTAPRNEVDPDATNDDDVEIGAVKLPVLISMNAVAKFVAAGGSDLIRLFAAELCRPWREHADEGDRLREMTERLEELSEQGHLLILIDGLDEVLDPSQRRAAIDIVARFAEQLAGRTERRNDRPFAGNQLVITSRIVGYHELRLPETWPHVVVDRMSENTVLTFWTRLFAAFGAAGLTTPADAAKHLHDLVFGDDGGNLEDLVGIPLLATLIAMAFRAGATLPKHRVEIYDAVVLHLVVEWRKGAGDGIDLKRWQRWLCPVARRLQERGEAGLVSDEDVTGILEDRLEELDPGITSSLQRTELVRRFRRDNDDYVGLLVERADGRYGFLHRTFQEYLAAAWLADVPDAFIERVLEHWDDPSWREAALLAFGHGSLRGARRAELRERFFEELLSGVDETARARLAMFLATATAEMPDPPSTRTMVQLLTEILKGLRGEPLNEQPDTLRQRFEDAVHTLADRDLGVFEEALGVILRDGGPQLACAAADVISLERWCTPTLLSGLKAALAYDVAERGFPIERTLRQMLTDAARHAEEPRQAATKPKRPKFDEEDATPEGRRQMTARMFDRRSHIHRLRKWRVSAGLTRPSTPRLTAEASALDQSSRTDPSWRAVAVSLLGAFGDRDAARGVNAYSRLALFLQEGDRLREAAISDNPWFVRMFGNAETVYKSAVALDTGDHHKDARTLPVVDLATALPLCALPEALLNAAAAGEDGSPQRLLELAKTTPSAEDEATMLYAAFAANIDNSLSVLDVVRGAAPEVREILGRLAIRAGAAVKDAAYRALTGLLRVRAKVEGSPDEEWCAALRVAIPLAIEAMARLAPTDPIQLGGSWAGLSDRLRAEQIAAALSYLPLDERRDSANEALAHLRDLSVWDIPKLLQLLPEAGAVIWSRAHETRSWGKVWARTERDHDLPPQVFDLCEARDLGVYDAAFGGQLIGVIIDRLAESVEIELAIALAGTYLVDDGDDGVFAVPHRMRQAWQLASVRRIADPYLRARGLLGVAEAGVSASGAILEEAQRLALDLATPDERFVLLDRLLDLRLGDPQGVVQRAATVAAQAIADPRQRWRACLRMSARNRGARPELLGSAVAALNEIADPILRAEEWTAARRLGGIGLLAFSGWTPSVHPPTEAVSWAARGTASGFRAPWLLRLQSVEALSQDAALALYLAQVSLDVTDAIAWAASLDAETALTGEGDIPAALRDAAEARPGAAAEALARFAQGRYELSFELAELIDRVAEHDLVVAERLAGMVHIESNASLGVAGAFLEANPRSPLAFTIALTLIQRTRRRDAAVLGPLLAALSGGDDERAAKACFALSRGTLLVKRPHRVLGAGEVGLESLLSVAAFGADPGNAGVKVICSCFLADLITDNPALLREICDVADGGGQRSDAARAVLRGMGEPSPACLEVLREALAQARPKTQEAILRGLSSVSHESASEMQGVIAELVCGQSANLTEPMPILMRGGRDVARVIADVVEHPGQADVLAAAKLALAEARKDLRVELGLPTEAHAALSALLDSVTNIGDYEPVMNAREKFDALAQAHGAPVVALIGAWLGELLARPDSDEELLVYLIFAAAQVGPRYPALLTEGLLSKLGTLAALQGSLVRLMGDASVGTAGASALRLACLVGPLDDALVRTILDMAKWPTARVFERILSNLDELRPPIAPSALPILGAAVQDPSARVAFVAIRLLGVLVRNPLIEAAPRRRSRALLEELLVSGNGARKLLTFVDIKDDVEGPSLRWRGSLRDAAVRELALADV